MSMGSTDARQAMNAWQGAVRRSEESALAGLPQDAAWSSSFGYPGEGGYREYYRTPDGARYVLANGPWHALRPFTWTLTQIEEAPPATP